MVIYFSILSLKQIIELKREAKGIQILHYVGKDGKQVRELVKKQIAIQLFIPMMMTFVLLLLSIPIINLKLNLILPITIRNIFLQSAGWFNLCFLFLLFFCSIYYKQAIYRKENE